MEKIFYKVVYYHIIYMYDFVINLDDFFAVFCTSFHENYGFHRIYNKIAVRLTCQLLVVHILSRFTFHHFEITILVCTGSSTRLL